MRFSKGTVLQDFRHYLFDSISLCLLRFSPLYHFLPFILISSVSPHLLSLFHSPYLTPPLPHALPPPPSTIPLTSAPLFPCPFPFPLLLPFFPPLPPPFPPFKPDFIYSFSPSPPPPWAVNKKGEGKSVKVLLLRNILYLPLPHSAGVSNRMYTF